MIVCCHVYRHRAQPQLAPRRALARGLARRPPHPQTDPRQPHRLATRKNPGAAGCAQRQLPPSHRSRRFSIERTRPHGHVAAVLGTLRRLKLEQLIGATRGPERDAVVAMIVARVLEPRSKLATARALRAATLSSTLGELLELSDCDEELLYRAMDWLLPRQANIEQALARRHLSEATLALYDVSSTYFEGRCCPLARYGYSRDGKRDKLQITFGLLTNAEGCPLAVEVFEGNTADPKTLGAVIAKCVNSS